MKTRKQTLVVATALLIFFSSAKAQEKSLGMGINIGNPVGLSAKAWLAPDRALAFTLGWSDGGFVLVSRYDRWYYVESQIHLTADYLWHDFSAFDVRERVPLHYGVGVRMSSLGGRSTFGVRGIVGASWLPRKAPIDVFLEVAPILHVAPFPAVGFDAGFGVRFYFE